MYSIKHVASRKQLIKNLFCAILVRMISPETITSLESISIVTAELIGILGVGIMCIGAVRATAEFGRSFYHKEDRMTEIRVNLMKHLSLGLEFLVAKDIIDTISDPTPQTLLLLGGIIILRTVIAYILNWELKEATESIGEEAAFEEAIEHFEELQKIHKHPRKK